MTYFGTTKEEEVSRIKDLWKKSLLVFIVVGVLMVVAEGSILAFFGGIVPFFLVWGFQAFNARRQIKKFMT